MLLAKEAMFADIRKGVSVLQNYVRPGGKLNLTDTNVQSEDFVAGLLNAVYGWGLVNANKATATYPCIDLIDETRKLGVQVTAEEGSGKINSTLECLEKHQMSERLSQLRVFSLVPKQGRYTVNAECPSVPFDWKSDVIDFDDILKQTQLIVDLEHLGRVHRYVVETLPSIFPDRKPAKPFQSSKVSSIYLPLRLPEAPGSGDVDPKMFEQFAGLIFTTICQSFAHTCVTTGHEDFVFLLTFQKSDCERQPGYVPIDLEIRCHISEFVRAVEEQLNAVFTGKAASSLKKLHSEQIFRIIMDVGRDLPFRIRRIPPSEIVVERVDGLPAPPDKHMTTSALLCFLSNALKKQILIWDDADQHVDLRKIMMLLHRAEKRFSWDEIRIDSNNPETWEYLG